MARRVARATDRSRVPAIDPDVARDVFWRGTQFVDVRRERRRLERCKLLAERVEQLLEECRQCEAEADETARVGGFISPIEKIRFRKVAEKLARAGEHLAYANGVTGRQATAARAWLRQEWLQDQRTGAGPGRPSRPAEFVRLMFERDPGLPRDLESWLELDRRIGFSLRTPPGGEEARRVIAQLLRRVPLQNRPAGK